MKYVCYLVSERNLLERLIREDIEFVQKREISFLSCTEEIMKVHAVILDPDYFSKGTEDLKSLLRVTFAHKTKPILLGLVNSFSDLEFVSDLPLDGIVSLEELGSSFFGKRLKLFMELFERGEKIEKLEKTNRDLVLTFLGVLDVKIPGIKERRDLSVDMAGYLADIFQLPTFERSELFLAVSLREIGKIGLEKRSLSFENLREYRTHCLIGKELLSKIESMRSVAELVGMQYERFDGQGFPSGLRGDEMSVSALIIQGITFVIELQELGLPSEEIIFRVRSEAMKTLDPYVANYLAQYLEEREVKTNGKTVLLSPDELLPGMVIAQDLYSVSGRKILPKGALITDHILEIIEKRKDVDPIVGCVKVYARKV